MFHLKNLARKGLTKSGPPHRRQLVHPRHQTLQWEAIANPETLLLIILSLACTSDVMEVRGN